MRETDIYNKLVDKSIHEMLNYPPKDYKKILKDCIKKLIGKTIYPTVKDPIAWPNALCALGLIERLKQDGLRGIGGATETNNAIFLALQQYFDGWIKDGAKIVKLESLLSGYVLLEYVEILESLIQKRGKSYCISAVRLATSEAELDEKMRSYETMIERFHQYLLTAKKDSNGTYIYNQSREEKIVMADMLGMVCPFLAKYARRYSSEEAAKECLKQLNGFLEKAVDENTSLPWHGYEEKSEDLSAAKRKPEENDSDALRGKEDTLTPVGILGWGRAVGWILLGIALSVKSLGNENMDGADSELLHSIISYAYDLIFKTYEIHKVCDEATEKDIHENAINSTLLRWQFADSENMVVDDLHVDTSATAMFVYSVYKLLSVDISTAKEIHELKLYLETLVNGLENNVKSDGSVINGLAECMGPGIHPQKYGSYPWTVGTTLSALCAQSVYCEK